MRIAFAGNPNSGKTTMYNALTGRNEKVGNWAGVTVDKKEALIKKAFAGETELIAVDLPGAYSMSPFTSEESITSSYVRNENPDAIINIVDATNLSRSLFFTTQLLELGIPVVVALNKHDINEKKQTKIDINSLAEKLGCPVLDTTATTGDGLREIVQTAAALRGKGQKAPYHQGDVDLTSKQAVEAADRKRFEFVNKIVASVETRKVLTREKNAQDKIDAVLTHPLGGLVIFAAVMFLVFQISQAWVGPWIADTLVGWLETFQEWVGGLVENAAPILQALLVDGILGGVIAVIGFLPLVMVMYFLISLLEDCGYMARATVVLDPIFKKVGLSGKSVIPFVVGTGCAIPGVMACRTIRNERERRATAMLTPFMPCGAKLPVIALFAGAFFADASWVGTLMYFVGIVLILLGALLVNQITGYRHRKSFFIMELPEYKLPSLKRAATEMCSRGWAFIVKAFTIILVCNTVVQIMQTFTWSFEVAEVASDSILASIAGPFAYLLVPIVGTLSWQLAAAAVTGFIAKENVVGTLAVCFVGLENLINTEELALMEGAGTEVASVFAITKVAALAYLMFNLYTPPCFAALGAMHAEINDRKWFWGGVGLQFATGFTVAYLVYQIGTLITTGSMGTGFLLGLIVVAILAAILIYLMQNANKNLAAEYALGSKS
ncbi:MAG: ferrous iron transporter B [Firmicutes bacterium]|nr:ferrous iron transporter B [Bacillota bacterium]MDY6159940.1 ferrous iron transporter B [Candidatus Faecousia sp.]